MTEKKDFLLRFPAEIHKKIKMLSVVEEKSMTDVIIEAIEEKLKKEGMGK